MNTDIEQSQELPSKTQRKREMIALQEIGVKLTTFNDTQLGKLPLSNKLRTAIKEFKRLPNSHGAKRRQLQYIGRLMRDHELADIEADIQKLLQPDREPAKTRQLIEQYCDLVLVDGDAGINALIQDYETLERQTLRKFHRDYRRAIARPDPEPPKQLKARLLEYLKKNQ
ncbi:MAG: DUF615 domain-containing protein [Gammaproteobacteria bacterium]|nr:DUF615 domain-containing protein [Gammaproteobacteria bacterium]